MGRLSGTTVRPVSQEVAADLLGVPAETPLTIPAMAGTLRVTCHPVCREPRLARFRDALFGAFARLDVSVVDFDAAVTEKGRVAPGVTQFAFGEGEAGNLATDRVSTLYNNPVVAVVYQAPPVSGEMAPRDILDRLAQDLVWHMAHILVYVTEHTWTVCTMNGSIVTGRYDDNDAGGIAEVLAPKLAAPIRPLRKADFAEYTFGETGFGDAAYKSAIDDMVNGAALFRRNGMLPDQTEAKALAYRTKRYQRIGAEFLDNRTGMSYGFVARQLPVDVRPARLLESESPHPDSLVVALDGARYAVDVPEVAVLCTRSGCNKGNIDPACDIVKLTRRPDGSMTFLASGAVSERDAKPSYDTQVILAHALGNAIVASLLAAVAPDAPFVRRLQHDGLALAHWHDHLSRADVPRGFAFHGDTNPGVSCSSPQAALFALLGKLHAFAALGPAERESYRGDVHIEPHHGTNVVEESLVGIGHWSTKGHVHASSG